MKEVFYLHPDAVSNTVRIGGPCEFNLATPQGYSLPEEAVPPGLHLRRCQRLHAAALL